MNCLNNNSEAFSHYSNKNFFEDIQTIIGDSFDCLNSNPERLLRISVHGNQQDDPLISFPKIFHLCFSKFIQKFLYFFVQISLMFTFAPKEFKFFRSRISVSKFKRWRTSLSQRDCFWINPIPSRSV